MGCSCLLSLQSWPFSELNKYHPLCFNTMIVLGGRECSEPANFTTNNDWENDQQISFIAVCEDLFAQGFAVSQTHSWWQIRRDPNEHDCPVHLVQYSRWEAGKSTPRVMNDLPRETLRVSSRAKNSDSCLFVSHLPPPTRLSTPGGQNLVISVFLPPWQPSARRQRRQQ